MPLLSTHVQLILALVCLALPAPAGAGPIGSEGPKAPDGQRGLGDDTPLPDLLKLFRTTREEERSFLAGLEKLPSELELLFAGAAESYRASGWFELRPSGATRDLGGLHAAWRAAEADPLELLAAGGAPARAFAQMALDARFRVRAELHDGLSTEVRELRAGLAVLRGAAEGYVLISADEAVAIALRVDLAASRLRAMRSDLLALRPSAARARSGPAGDPQVDALLVTGRGADPVAARAAVEQALDRARKRSAAMRSALFSARLEPEVAHLLEWRERMLVEAARLRREALEWMPDTEEGRAAPPEVAALRKHERVRWAGFRAREGLAADPLDDVLAFIAAHAADFQWGSLESVPLYDRFLVLRGVRHYDHRTLRGRELDAWEDEALLAVQRPYQPPPPPPVTRKDR